MYLISEYFIKPTSMESHFAWHTDSVTEARNHFEKLVEEAKLMFPKVEVDAERTNAHWEAVVDDSVEVYDLMLIECK